MLIIRVRNSIQGTIIIWATNSTIVRYLAKPQTFLCLKCVTCLMELGYKLPVVECWGVNYYNIVCVNTSNKS